MCFDMLISLEATQGGGLLGRLSRPAYLFVQFNLTARLQRSCNRDCVKIITAPLLIRCLQEMACWLAVPRAAYRSAASMTQRLCGLFLPSSGYFRNCPGKMALI